MSVQKDLYGTTRTIPVTNDTVWGDETTAVLEDLVDGVEDTTAQLVSTQCVARSTSTTTTIAAAGTLTPTYRVHKVSGSGAAVTLSATTAIADGEKDGQLLTLMGNHATYTVTILDGANTQLNGNVTLEQYETIELRWDTTLSAWQELTRSN